MKDSGIPWLGEIPERWKLSKIKWEYTFTTGATPSSKIEKYYDGDIKWVTISDLGEKRIYDTVNKLSQEGVDSCSMSISQKGSLLYSFKLSVGTVSFCGEDMYTNEAIATFNSKNNELSYLYYAAPLMIIHNANTNIYGAKILNQELIKNAITLLPPLPEQQAIAKFLDKRCAEIDELIGVEEKIKGELLAYKQSIITETVTRGLNPNVPMKESGILWLGEIPEHWDICFFKRLVRIYNGSDYKHIQVDEGGFPVIGSGGEFARAGDFLYDGEAIFIGRKGTIDKPFYFRGKFWAIDTIFYCVPLNNATGKYFYYQATTFPYERYITSTAKPSLTQTDLGDFIVVNPPLSEQRAIVEYLDKRCAEIDSLVALKQQKIDELKEYKQSVIYEYVTGKKEIH